MITARISIADAARILQEAGIENPRFEARLLLALVLGVSTTAVTAGTAPEPNAQQSTEFARLIAERARRVPLAYLRGTQEFYGREFAVSPAVLVPRPETEMLVDFALEIGKSRAEFSLADVGTGSGCIAVSTIANLPNARATALDVSPDALAIAQENAVRNQVSERVDCVLSDLLENAVGKFDLIVSNPPYIPSFEIEGLQPEVRDFEPRLALDGGADGLEIYRRLIAQAAAKLVSGGWLAVEVGQGQAQSAAALFHENGLQNIEIRRDLADIERVVAAQKI